MLSINRNAKFKYVRVFRFEFDFAGLLISVVFGSSEYNLRGVLTENTETEFLVSRKYLILTLKHFCFVLFCLLVFCFL